ncbi:uncharacterized protein PAC_08674 [Phialocephala subalpina]|uniref:Uncharacterized protein n=1 Tax=Phialocephala subalpina TaxID=576137 RepID=A0A1L7X190_9HELO|nr:uncharacterized protein PAC_08674 [Phialocephala subalpina]
MDPLSALSLAGNVVQFIDFGITLLSGAFRLYKSPSGALPVNDEIELITDDLKALIVKLKGSDYATTLPDDGLQRISFGKICEGATEVAEELLRRLSKLKLRDGKQGNFISSIQQAVKTCWKEKEINELLKRLKSFKEALETRVLFSLRQSLDNHSIYASARFDQLDIQTQHIAKTLLESGRQTTQNICQEMSIQLNEQTLAFTQLMSRLESLNRDDHRQTRDTFNEIMRTSLARRRNSPGTSIEGSGKPRLEYTEIVSDIEMLDVSDTIESTLRTFVGESILWQVQYPGMTSRYEDVIEAHPKTFEWAFCDSTAEQCSWSNLSQWLQQSNGVYWICGKAGSGKSTLMKHIFDDERTTTFLKAWAGPTPLVIATFFFWNSGTNEQRSQKGLLRSLLFQILSKHPGLIPIVAPQQWAELYSRNIMRNESGINRLNRLIEGDFPLRSLEGMFRALLNQKIYDLKICFMVDGLDEFEGDHEEISTFFSEVASFPGIKVCLSSRPWPVFEELFAACPKLRLQDLTYRDIKYYVSDKMRRNSAFQRLELEEPLEAPTLIEEIVEKAKGVFIWVKLVVQSLLNGLRNQDELSDLKARLRDLPEEIKPLYRQLLNLVEPVYVPWVSKAFQIVRNVHDLSTDPFRNSFSHLPGVKPLSLVAFWQVMNPGLDQTDLDDPSAQKYSYKCKRFEVQLKARCAGLLEISNTRGETVTGKDRVVQYFHRTARDFLETSASSTKLLLDTANIDFRLNISLMRSCIGSLRIVSARPTGGPWPEQTKTIHGLVNDFMMYAYHAEERLEDPKAQAGLLDQLSSFMAMQSKEKRNGSCHWITEMWPLGGDPDFIDLVTLYGLRTYVEKKLQQYGTSEMKSIAAELLQYLLPIQDCFVCYGMPVPKLEMVSLLLDYGAETMTYNSSFQSTWENVVYYMLNTTMLNDCHVESSMIEYNPRVLHLRYGEVMKMIASVGTPADENTPGPATEEERSFDRIEKLLMKTFPQETSTVMSKLHWLYPEHSHTSSKRTREPEECTEDWLRRPKRLKVDL